MTVNVYDDNGYVVRHIYMYIYICMYIINILTDTRIALFAHVEL